MYIYILLGMLLWNALFLDVINTILLDSKMIILFFLLSCLCFLVINNTWEWGYSEITVSVLTHSNWFQLLLQV